MDKSAFVGVVWSSAICQGPGSLADTCMGTDLGSNCEFEVACERTPIHLSHYPGSSKKCCLRQSPPDIWAFVEVQVFQQRSYNISWKKKKYNFVALEKVEETVWLYLHYPSKAAQLSTKTELLTPWFLPWGKMTTCEWASTLPDVQDGVKEAHFSLAISRVLHNLGQEETTERTLEGH